MSNHTHKLLIAGLTATMAQILFSTLHYTMHSKSADNTPHDEKSLYTTQCAFAFIGSGLSMMALIIHSKIVTECKNTILQKDAAFQKLLSEQKANTNRIRTPEEEADTNHKIAKYDAIAQFAVVTITGALCIFNVLQPEDRDTSSLFWGHLITALVTKGFTFAYLNRQHLNSTLQQPAYSNSV